MTLSVGNVLNGGSEKGQADGFSMELIKMSKLKAMKDSNGNSLMQYICKQIIIEDDNFHTEIFKLVKLFKVNMRMTDIQTPYIKINGAFNEAKNAYLDSVEQMQPNDIFKNEVGGYIVDFSSS